MKIEDFDSPEEFHFYSWLIEANQHGLVSNIKPHPYSFRLSERVTIPFDKHMKTKIKTVNKFILHPHVYTPDFAFCIENDKIRELNLFVENHGKNGKFMIVDVKGGFSKFGDSKQFSINQKWTWDKYGVYVQKIVPEKLFNGSWVPEVCRYTPKQRKPVKKYDGCKTIAEFVGGL